MTDEGWRPEACRGKLPCGCDCEDWPDPVVTAAGGRSAFPDVLRCVRGDGAFVTYPWPAVETVQRVADEAGMDVRVPCRNVIEDDAEHKASIERAGWRLTGDGWICPAHAPDSGEIMDHHSVVRDGEHWWCRHCKRTWPFPGQVPSDAGPCVRRAWVADAAQP